MSSRLEDAGYYVNPHPAAIALGRVLARIQSAFHLESASVTDHDPLRSEARRRSMNCRNRPWSC